jgi:hypothetical protein
MLDAKKDIKADQRIQAKLEQLISSIQLDEKKELTRERLRAVAKELKTSYNDADLIPQIVLYEATAKKEQTAIATNLLLLQFIEDLGRSRIMGILSPFLSTDNERIKTRLYEIMNYCCEGRPTIDFNRIFSMMRAKGGAIPDGLVAYMYDRSPGEAMLGYMRYYNIERSNPERQNLLLAEREVGNTLWKHQFLLLEHHKVEPSAMVESEKLSRHKEWWVRLYVAEIMRQHKGFRQPETIERLKKDKHPLVRETIAGFAQTID